MKLETEEWVAKAEGDRQVALREMQAATPVWDVICFLRQQCAEKYLKAFLEEHNIQFLKTHDLVVLLNSSAGRLSELDPHKQDLAYLSTLGIAARYPGTEADRQAAEDAERISEQVRTVVRNKLGLS
jgi:HEPN domain-containing protein